MSFRPWLACLMLLAAHAVRGEEYGFTIQDAGFGRQQGQYLLNARIEYRFNPAAIEALENGIPLTLEFSLSIACERPWRPDETVFRENHRVEVRFHPLAKSFQIIDRESGATQGFAGMGALMDALGQIRNWPVLEVSRLPAGRACMAGLQVRLDIESLPLPLRTTAYLSLDWHLASPMYTWPVEP